MVDQPFHTADLALPYVALDRFQQFDVVYRATKYGSFYSVKKSCQPSLLFQVIEFSLECMAPQKNHSPVLFPNIDMPIGFGHTSIDQ
jgi:hypothetical protein